MLHEVAGILNQEVDGALGSTGVLVGHGHLPFVVACHGVENKLIKIPNEGHTWAP